MRGMKMVDGQQIMLNAREIKNVDEITLLNPGGRDGRWCLPHGVRRIKTWYPGK